MFTTNELERYDRQIMIRGFGEEGQEKLKRAKVIIAGGGGRSLSEAVVVVLGGDDLVVVCGGDGLTPPHREGLGEPLPKGMPLIGVVQEFADADHGGILHREILNPNVEMLDKVKAPRGK